LFYLRLTFTPQQANRPRPSPIYVYPFFVVLKGLLLGEKYSSKTNLFRRKFFPHFEYKQWTTDCSDHEVTILLMWRGGHGPPMLQFHVGNLSTGLKR
jgi:hypothetical protein